LSQAKLIESLHDFSFLDSHAAQSLNGKCDYLAQNLVRNLGCSDLARYSNMQSSLMMEINAQRHFQYLQSFVEVFDPSSFVEVFKWMLRTYNNHGFPFEYWQIMLPESRKILKKEIPTYDFKQIAPIYDWLLVSLDKIRELSLAEESYFEQIVLSTPLSLDNNDDSASLKKISDIYVDFLLQGKRSEAIELIISNVNGKIALEDVYLKILQPAMYTVGKKWQNNEINIAVEHYCTAATQMLLAMLFPLCLGADTKKKKKMLGCCLGSELHELGMRMVSDFFEFAGWSTYFLGAVTPSESLVETIKKEEPDVVCLSVSMYFGVPQAEKVIKMIKGIDTYPPPKVLVGGLAFNVNPELSVRIGADGFSGNASEAIKVAEQLCGS